MDGMQAFRQNRPSVSVIIPTLNAEKEIDILLKSLVSQTVLPLEIMIMDSDSQDRTLEIVKRYPSVHSEKVAVFNHGGTRDLAARMTKGDILLFMTQDAKPAGSDLIEKLVKSLQEHPRAAAVYARQLPREDARPAERLVRSFTYPDHSAVHDAHAVADLGLRAFYLSNVCAAYWRNIYIRLGGFEKDLRSNEDMLFAARAIQKGYEVVYNAEALVIHSHHLSLSRQYRRNRLQGYELARHRTLLGNDSPVGSGKAMFLFVTKGLLRHGRILSWTRFCMDCGARYLGNRAGKREYERKKHGNIG